MDSLPKIKIYTPPRFRPPTSPKRARSPIPIVEDASSVFSPNFGTVNKDRTHNTEGYYPGLHKPKPKSKSKPESESK